ncbi:60 kDa SS-A/Ro ribonucleoprotein [Chamberlinius hualienensis]
MSCCRETADLNRVVNYVLLGHNDGCFYQTGKRNLASLVQRLTYIEKLISEKRGPEVVKVLSQLSGEENGTDNRSTLDNNYRIFALIHCTLSDDLETKKAAFEAFPVICPTAKDLLSYINLTQQLARRSTGWGRAQRKAVSKWYNEKSAKDLVTTCFTYTSSRGWTHRDIVRLAHVKPTNKATAAVLIYMKKGLDAMLKDFENDVEAADVVSYIKAIHSLHHTTDEKEAAYLIERHGLQLEMIQSTMRKSPEIWRTLIPLLPLQKVLLHLRRFAQIGFLNPNSIVYSSILDQLKDHSKLPTSNLHPVDVFLALKKYEDLGKNVSTRNPPTTANFRLPKRRLNTAVVDALHNMFTASLQKCVKPLNKKLLVTVDVRNPMVHSKVHGCPQLTPALASAIVILSLLNADDDVTVTAFSSHDLKILDLSKDMSLLEIAKRMRETPMGPVNCLKPLQWAKQHNKPFDAFIVLTDNQVKPSDLRLGETLAQYRAALNLPNSRLFLCSLSARRLIAPSTELNGVIEIGGFDSYVPRMIANFIQSPMW